MAAPTNLHRDLGRMEGKLDAVLSEMRGGLRQAHARLDEHDLEIARLKAVENQRAGAVRAARWLWGGLTAGIGALAGAFGGGFMR